MAIETLEELKVVQARVERLKVYLASAPTPKDDWEKVCLQGTEATILNLEEDVAEYLSRPNVLVQTNIRLVVSIAKTYHYSGVPFEDLVQEGAIGLMTAAERFNPTRGFLFSTYATLWIRRAIRRLVESKQSKHESKQEPGTELVSDQSEILDPNVHGLIGATQTLSFPNLPEIHEDLDENIISSHVELTVREANALMSLLLQAPATNGISDEMVEQLRHRIGKLQRANSSQQAVEPKMGTFRA